MTQDYDAQRTLEQKALLNVRALVDNLEERDRTSGLRALKLAAIVVCGVIIGIPVTFLALMALFPGYRGAELAGEAGRSRATLAELKESRDSYSSNPRRTFVGHEMEPRFQDYVDRCVAKIGKLANSTYRSEWAGLEGTAQITVAIRFDGLIEGVQVNKWSGHAAIEPTARRIVRMVDSCGPFPEEIRRDTDILHITRTLHFIPKTTGVD